MPRVERVGVVVPARNEAVLLPRCLRALRVAASVLYLHRPDVALSMLIVLDSCVDESAAVVAEADGMQVLSVEAGSVGAARQAGVARLAGTVAPDWYAMSDADSAVPPEWLVGQVEAATAGADLLLGTVVPDSTEISPDRFARWQAQHRVGHGHGHIYGANLGFSGRALTAAGGFRTLPVHEDVDLAERIKAAGLCWVASAAAPVLTSARTVGRTPDGFAGYLRAN